MWFGLTVAFITVPSIVMTTFSLKWYIIDHKHDKKNNRKTASVVRWVSRFMFLMLQLSPMLRYDIFPFLFWRFFHFILKKFEQIKQLSTWSFIVRIHCFPYHSIGISIFSIKVHRFPDIRLQKSTVQKSDRSQAETTLVSYDAVRRHRLVSVTTNWVFYGSGSPIGATIVHHVCTWCRRRNNSV